ncbi:MAG: hypothetical protein ACREDR_22205, partial [Blastocatellia bacterium]
DAAGLWEKLYWLGTHHNAVRSFIGTHDRSHDWARDAYLDVTQDLFVRLLEKNRFQHYLDANYSDDDIEHELRHLEIPNLISLELRKRHPEAFRITRRISDTLKTSPEFKYFRSATAGSQASGRLVSRVYGLACWISSAAMIEESRLPELIKSVQFRMRETRRSGRGKFSQIIISNKALCQLLIDIFNATQSLMDVRTVRLLALSKIAVEDSRFVSIDEHICPQRIPDSEPYQIDVADKRPTPEEALINQETAREVDHLADNLIGRLKHGVKNKPRRFSKLVRVVWHCYFDPVSRSQGEIADLIDVSDSLVCHYRKLFDSYLKEIEIPANHWVILNRSIEIRLASIVADLGPIQVKKEQHHRLSIVSQPECARACAAGAAAGF